MPKSRLALILATCGALAVAGAIVFAVMNDASPESSSADPGEKVRIEVRAMPVADLTVDGKQVGKTPMVLQFARSDRSIVIEARMQPHIYDMRNKQRVGGPVIEQRTVKLDHDQVVDFLASRAQKR